MDENNRMLPESMELCEENFNNAKYFKIKQEKDVPHEIKVKNDTIFDGKTENLVYNDYADTVMEEKMCNPNACKDSVLENNNVYDQLTINISQLGTTVKTDKESETISEINITSRKVYSKRKDKSLECNVKIPQKTKNSKSICSSIIKRKREKCKWPLGTLQKPDKRKFTKKSTKTGLKSSHSCKRKKIKSTTNLSGMGGLLNHKDIPKNISLVDCARESDKKMLNSITCEYSCLADSSNNQDNIAIKDSKDVNTGFSLCKVTNDAANSLCNSAVQVRKDSEEADTEFYTDDNVAVTQECTDSSLVMEQSANFSSNAMFPEEKISSTQKEVYSNFIELHPADKLNSNHSLIEMKPFDKKKVFAFKEEDSLDMVAEEHIKGVIDETSKALSLSGLEAIAPIKKKLSILEYRKRKSISCDSDSKEDITKPIERPGSRSMSLDSESNCKKIISSEWEERTELSTESKPFETPLSVPVPPRMSISLDESICSPPSPLSPSFLDDIKISDQCQELINSPPKWNAAPTLLEQQRETLTARLRKNFGFCIPEKNNDQFDAIRSRSHETILATTKWRPLNGALIASTEHLSVYKIQCKVMVGKVVAIYWSPQSGANSEKSIEEKLADIEKRMSLSEKLKVKAPALSLSVSPSSYSSHVSAMSIAEVSDVPSEIENSSILKVPVSGILRPLTSSSEGVTEDFPKPMLYGVICSDEICEDLPLVTNKSSPLPCENTTLLQLSPRETLVEALVPSNKVIHPDFCNSSDL